MRILFYVLIKALKYESTARYIKLNAPWSVYVCVRERVFVHVCLTRDFLLGV